MNDSLHTLGVAALARALAARQVSSVELTQALLTGIAAHADLGAFLATSPQAALAQKMSFWAIGMPVRGNASLFAIRWSAARACASETSGFSVM